MADAGPSHAERMMEVPAAIETPADQPELNSLDAQSEGDVDADAERARRVRVRRDMLQQEIEIAAMEQQLAVLRRRRRHGAATPAASEVGEDGAAGDQALSASASHAHRGLSNRPRLREPNTFKGKTLKEARDFVRSLELVFALAPDVYQYDRERVLYGVMFLAGEPSETWHHNHSVDALGDYQWCDFKRFVFDAVEDPANRTLSTIVAYESARQGENQTVQAFATELATLEEQMDPYTPAQRTRHLLAKLKPALRTSIITHHDVPQRREDLISLATRLESAEKRSSGAPAPHKRSADDSHDRRSKKRRGNPSDDRSEQKQQQRKDGAGAAKADVVCYGCGKPGHYKTSCPNKHEWDKKEDRASTRKVAASADQAKKKKGDGEKEQD